MKYLIVFFLAAAASLSFIIGCTGTGMSGPAGTDHPYPVTPSIMPLSIGNWWKFHYTLFDSTGKPRNLPDRDLILRITGVYELTGSDSLTEITDWSDRSEECRMCVYKYEWENLDSGYLVQHRGDGPFERRGLYIVGEFNHGLNIVYDTSRMWYQYPAYSESRWEVDLPGGGTALSAIECTSLNHPDYMINFGGGTASPYSFLDSCILFRQVVGNDSYYHSFKPEIGKISMQHYSDGILSESYILVEYHRNDGRWITQE